MKWKNQIINKTFLSLFSQNNYIFNSYDFGIVN